MKISNWKDFLILNPWATSGLLQELYGMKPYDLSNWRKANAGAREFLDNERPNWNLAQLEDPDLIRRSLTAQMKFYLEEVLDIDLEASSCVELLRTLSGPKKPWGRLIQKKYVSKLPEFSDHESEGYTIVSFLIYEIYPGKHWCEVNGLYLHNFPQRKVKAIDFVDAVQMLKDIYFTQISEVEDRHAAMKILLIRRTEQEFLKNEDFTSKGVSTRVFSIYTKDLLFDRIEEDFKKELGEAKYGAAPTNNWSATKFRKLARKQLETCCYCERSPVDLHHLIERSADPTLTFHAENVVPLCTQAHALISRNRMSDSAKQMYNEARLAWRKAPIGHKATCFDKVMQVIHSEAYRNDISTSQVSK